MVLKEKFEAAQKAVSAARDAVTALGGTVSELDTCLAQSQESILQIDKKRDQLKDVTAQYVAKHGELVEVERKLKTANDAMAALKAKL